MERVAVERRRATDWATGLPSDLPLWIRVLREPSIVLATALLACLLIWGRELMTHAARLSLESFTLPESQAVIPIGTALFVLTSLVAVIVNRRAFTLSFLRGD